MLCIVVALIAVCASGVGGQLVNGDFEVDIQDASWASNPAPGYKYQIPTGWTGTNRVITIATFNGDWGTVPAQSNNYFLGLQNYNSADGFSEISQALTPVSTPATYDVTFFYRVRAGPCIGGGTLTLSVSVDGVVAQTIPLDCLSFSASWAPNTAFELVVPCNATPVLQFSATLTGATSAIDQTVFLDNIKLTQTKTGFPCE
jgi:hypothetical protein